MGGLTSTIHAVCLCVGESGVLIRGQSGSGKSALALDLVVTLALEGRFGRIVGDDRIVLQVRHGRLLARSHPLISGRAEVRGHGIISIDAEPTAVIRVVVDLVDGIPDRMPKDGDSFIEINGVCLPRITVPFAIPALRLLRRLNLSLRQESNF